MTRRVSWKEFEAELDRREATLAASGLPECRAAADLEMALDELAAKPAGEIERHADEADRRRAELSAHYDRCPRCLARDNFETERFGPLPEIEQGRFLRAVDGIGALPPLLVGPAYGAIAAGVMFTVRAIGLVVASGREPERSSGLLGTIGLGLVASLAIGVGGGFCWSLARHVTRPLGRVSEYISGIASVAGVLTVSIVAAPAALGKPLIEAREWWLIPIFSLVFGIIFGHKLGDDEPEAQPR